jgi:hypothetical protein
MRDVFVRDLLGPTVSLFAAGDRLISGVAA